MTKKKNMITVEEFISEVYKVEKVKIIADFYENGNVKNAYVEHYPHKIAAKGKIPARMLEIQNRVKPILDKSTQPIVQVSIDLD